MLRYGFFEKMVVTGFQGRFTEFLEIGNYVWYRVRVFVKLDVNENLPLASSLRWCFSPTNKMESAI
jgi:hypothetical protein